MGRLIDSFFTIYGVNERLFMIYYGESELGAMQNTGQARERAVPVQFLPILLCCVLAADWNEILSFSFLLGNKRAFRREFSGFREIYNVTMNNSIM